MHRCVTRNVFAVFTLVLACAAAAAQPAPAQSPAGQGVQSEEALLKQVVDGIMPSYLAQIHAPGAIVAISLHGHRYFFSYGSATGAGVPFSPDTLVEIGSCTKSFTTTLFALAINRGQMDPNAPVQKYMPSGYKLQPEAQSMTPLELADFTSGLPRLPQNLPQQLQMRSIENYTTKDFLQWVSSWKPDSTLPAPYQYSNAGIGLLSYLIMTATGKQWDDQLNTEILQPLGMPDTTLRPSPQQMKRMATAQTPNGQDAPSWPVYSWYAAGSLRSTARDMLSFGEANLGHTQVNGKPVPPELTAAMHLAQKPIYTLPNGATQQAMAWTHRVVPPANPQSDYVDAKDGLTAGFSTVIADDPGKDVAIFIAVNKALGPIVATSIKIVNAIP